METTTLGDFCRSLTPTYNVTLGVGGLTGCVWKQSIWWAGHMAEWRGWGGVHENCWSATWLRSLLLKVFHNLMDASWRRNEAIKMHVGKLSMGLDGLIYSPPTKGSRLGVKVTIKETAISQGYFVECWNTELYISNILRRTSLSRRTQRKKKLRWNVPFSRIRKDCTHCVQAARPLKLWRARLQSIRWRWTPSA